MFIIIACRNFKFPLVFYFSGDQKVESVGAIVAPFRKRCEIMYCSKNKSNIVCNKLLKVVLDYHELI